MAEITLSDYAGYIFLEMIKARELADGYTRQVAERYAEDPVMRHFSAPRFRTPKVTLTIPVLVAGARFTETVRFDFPEDEFVTFVVNRAADVVTSVGRARWRGCPQGPAEPPSIPRSPAVERIAREFHRQLAANRDPRHPEPIVTVRWTQIFTTCLVEGGLKEFFDELDPAHRMVTETTAEVLDMVRRRTVVDRTAIESLLINPETNVVKNGSDETSVFTVTAELVEEGVFFRSVRDDSTGAAATIVEFE